MIVCLLAWDIVYREAPPVQAQTPYQVVRLGTSPNDWMNRVNNNGKKLVAVVPIHDEWSGDHQNSFISILQ